VAALVAGWTCNRFGRKATMTAGGLAFGIGTALVAAAQNIAMLVVGRIILGVGVGFATQATPLYLSEMAPHSVRGALNIMFQLAVTIGIFSAQMINYGTLNIPDYGWRISLAMGGVPAILLFVGSLILPDTPNSLVARGHTEEGRAVLQRIRGTEDVDAEYEDIAAAVVIANKVTNPYRNILQRRYLPQLIMSIFLPFFQQFTGINAIMFYAPQMFEAAGQSGSDSLMSTCIVGAVNVFATLVAIALVDRFGRKFLFMAGECR
jgi:sugar porter (SP) family MFS transporter